MHRLGPMRRAPAAVIDRCGGPGTVAVTVWALAVLAVLAGGTTPAGAVPPTPARSFAVADVPAPVVTSVFPSVGPPGGGTTVTIDGRNLSGASAVAFGGVPAAGFTANPDGSITAVSPTHVGGTVDVTVTTAGGTSAVSGADGFTYAVTGASPGPAVPGSGYDLVGADGGVFVFPLGQPGGFYGSLPADGVGVHDIVGMVPTADDRGYFVVGADGGVFAFGDAPYLGSLPGSGVHTTAVVGIAAIPSGRGYWLVTAGGTVYAFGDAPAEGSVASPTPVTGIEATPDGGGYWVVTRNGSVYAFGDAGYFGSLPQAGVSPSQPVIGLVPTADQQGYWLVGADGGIFAFGDAPFAGSLPGLGLAVDDVVGAVPTTT